MILVDASVWNDHFRRRNPIMREILDRRFVLGHPFVRGEVSLGSMAERADVLDMLDSLPQANLADHLEVATMIKKRQWFSTGIGYVDAHLLASLILTPASKLWTSDAALHRLAGQLGRTFSAAD